MSAAEYKTRVLVAEDWQSWKQIRLQSLKESPAAFGRSYEEEILSPNQKFMDMITDNTIFGAFLDNQLVSVVGFMRNSGERYCHRGKIFGVYTDPTARGRGMCKALMQLAIDHARTVVVWLEIHVWTENPTAFKLYSSLGFKTYCTEFRALRLSDTEFVDYHLMRIDFLY